MRTWKVSGCLAGAAMMLALAAGAADYYVSTGGSDATGDGSLATPWLTLNKGITVLNVTAGYNTLNVGAGTFPEINLKPTVPMRIVGAGVGTTILGAANYRFVPNGAALAMGTAAEPMVFKDFSFASHLHLISTSGANPKPDHWLFENIGVSVTQPTGTVGYGFRTNNVSTATTVEDDWTFRNVSITNNTQADGKPGTVIFMRNASGAKARHSRWTWENSTITDNGVDLMWKEAGNMVASDFTLNNTTWSRNSGIVTLVPGVPNNPPTPPIWAIDPVYGFGGNGGSFVLNSTTDRDFLGTNTIANSTIEDNNTQGVYAGRMGAGANLLITNSTIRDTNAGFDQTTGVYVSVPAGIEVGALRITDSLFGGPGTTGILVADQGGSQARPIELKNVNFADSAVGLAITGNNLFYIDPSQSNATIDAGGTLVTGGRLTYYGDANMNGWADWNDRLLVLANMNTGLTDATWQQGDFTFDGLVNELDWFYVQDAKIPEPGSLSLLAVAALLACQRRRRRA